METSEKIPDQEAETTPPITSEEDRLLTLKETAIKLGYTYRSFAQARLEGRVLLPEVKTSDGAGARPKYRLSVVMRAVSGEIKALRSAPFPEEQKERVHKRQAELRAQRKKGGDNV